MKAHDLARKLLAGPDLPVIINGWGSDEGSSFQVNDVSPKGKASFNGTFDTAKTKRNDGGWIADRPCLCLQYGSRTPPSKKDLARERARKRKMEHDRRTMTPQGFAFCYAEIKPLTPDDMEALAKKEQDFGESLSRRLAALKKGA